MNPGHDRQAVPDLADWTAAVCSLGVYYLFTEATCDQTALIITQALFWIFGFWALLTPLVSAWKVRSVFSALERVESSDQLRELLA